MTKIKDSEDWVRRRVDESPLNGFVINHIQHGARGNAVNTLPKNNECHLHESRQAHTIDGAD